MLRLALTGGLVLAAGGAFAWPGCAQTDGDATEAATTLVRIRERSAHVHSVDPARAGTTAHLIAHDPLRAYAAGRELFTRQFGDAEGVFGRPIARPLLDDGETPLVPGGRVASCLMCHNTPLRDGGAGPTIEKNGPSGRNTPHLFGGGLVEMIGWEIRLRVLAAADSNGNGFVDREEATGVRAVVDGIAGSPEDGPTSLDFGRHGDADGDGRPDLDLACRVWFVDASGRRIVGARRLDDPGVAGYDLEVQVFGWGHSPTSRAPLSSTLRGFSAAAFNVHSGLQAHDPTLNAESDGRGVTGLSLLGAPQFFTGRTPDAGHARNAQGESLDDPDGDGVGDELTQGDMDLLEFFLLHHPAPAERTRDEAARRGRALFSQMGCVRCHVPDWSLPAADAARGSTGDRRRFAAEVAPDPVSGTLRGRVEPLTSRRGALVVRGVYSDFRYHDLGPAFHQRQFDGSVVRLFRTPPLWGVGSSAPYGHDGASLDLDAVIRRHGGDASRDAAAYASSAPADREALLAFLRGLVLYAVDDAVPELRNAPR